MILKLFYFCNLIFASPYPLAGSSFINNIQSNLVFTQLAFNISEVPTTWSFKNTSDLVSKSIELGPSDLLSKSILSFRLETVSTKINLEQYVRQYLRDYNQYGFEIVNLQSQNKNTPQYSIVVDLSQKNKMTKSRQVFFRKVEKVIIATCLDDVEHFEKSILICNQILGTFQWK